MSSNSDGAANDVLDHAADGGRPLSIGVIRKLDDTTINRIAAGEVVQRPSAAVKEMIENSLDAKSTSIAIVVKDGGLQSLQIQDNGSGIHKDDLSICCERFTTSKLTNFNDLKTITSFGFRGEALASITHVARVSIVTRTSSDPCAYKAKYCDGKMIAHKIGEKPEAKPCAGVKGTTILVEDLFYNMPTRKTTFKNTNEEYQRIYDVVMKYAVHYGDKGISFSCKKLGSSSADSSIHTPLNSNTLVNIKYFYGAVLARELLHLEMEIDEQVEKDPEFDARANVGQSICATEEDLFSISDLVPPVASAAGASSTDGRDGDNNTAISTRVQCTVSGYVSNANFSIKKPTCIVFVNNRLVECASLKRVVESVYAPLLPKHTHPFIYLSLTMPAAAIDVNVHPTKREVHFLHEDLILRRLHAHVSSRLGNSNESRVFYAQSLITPSLTALAAKSSNTSNNTGSSKSVGLESPGSVSPIRIEQSTAKSPSRSPSKSVARLQTSVTTTPALPSSSGSWTARSGVATSSAQQEQEQEKEHELSDDPIESYGSDHSDPEVGLVTVAPGDVVQVSTNTNVNPMAGSKRSSAIANANASTMSSARRSTSTKSSAVANPSKLVRVDFRNTHLEQYFGHFNKDASNATAAAADGAAATAVSLMPTGNGIDIGNGAASDADIGLFCGECISSAASGSGRKKRRLQSGSSSVSDSGTGSSSEVPSGLSYLAGGRCSCCGVERFDSAGNVASGAVHIASVQTQPRAMVKELTLTTSSYDSVQLLLRQIHDPRRRDTELENVIKQHVYVGPISSPHYCLVQVGTRLLLLDLFAVTLEFFYQCVIKQFECVPTFRLQTPVNIYDCILMVVSQPDFDQWGDFTCSSNGTDAAETDNMNMDIDTKVETSDPARVLLVTRQRKYAAFLVGALRRYRDLLEEYFHVGISTDSDASAVEMVSSDDNCGKNIGDYLVSMPALLAGAYFPSAELLPLFLYELSRCAAVGTTGTMETRHARDSTTPPAAYAACSTRDVGRSVSWSTEQACFVSIAECLASYYTNSILHTNPMDGNTAASAAVDTGGSGIDGEEPPSAAVSECVKSVLLPHLRAFYTPTVDYKMPAANPDNYFGKQRRMKLGTGSSSHVSIGGPRAIELTRLEQLYKIFERC